MSELTREKILEMKPGKITDKAIIDFMGITTKTFGEDVYPFAFWNGQRSCWCIFWKNNEDAQEFKPSVDISSAWKVIEEMKKNGWFYQLADAIMLPEHICNFFAPDQKDASALAKTVQLAICQAALFSTLKE